MFFFSAIFIRFNQVTGGVASAGSLSIDFIASEALGPWGDLDRTIASAKKMAYDRHIRLLLTAALISAEQVLI